MGEERRCGCRLTGLSPVSLACGCCLFSSLFFDGLPRQVCYMHGGCVRYMWGKGFVCAGFPHGIRRETTTPLDDWRQRGGGRLSWRFFVEATFLSLMRR